MPAAVPIVAAAAFSGLAAAGFVGFSVAAFAGALVLGGLSYALTPKPKKQGTLTNKGQTVSVRQSDLTRQHVFGHTRITRGFAHMESNGSTNQYLTQMLILCEGPVRAINEIILNDYPIPNDWIDENGNVTQGRYKSKLTIRKHLGTETQLADSLAVFNLDDWTEDHRLQGIAYLYITLVKDQNAYPSGTPNISAIVEGVPVYDPRIDSERWTSNMALVSHNFIRNDIYGFGALEDDVDLTNIAAQANICDEMVNVALVTRNVEGVDPLTDIISVSGDVLSFQFGDRVQLFANGATMPGGLSEGVNYYVIPYQVNRNPEGPGPRILLAATFDDSLDKIAINITSAGTSGITISKNGEPRYHGAGVVDTETPLSDTLNAMASSMAGRATNSGGFWTLLAGAWRTPDISLSYRDVRGDGMGLKSCLSMSDSFNIIKGLYVTSENNYQDSDYPSIVYPQFIEDDGGQESPKDLPLPYTNRVTTAQRIAKIELFRGRQDIVYNSDFSLAAMVVKPGDNIEFTVDKYGWSDKYFEITEFNFVIREDKLFTRLTLRETAQEIFDWTSGEAIDFDPAPNTNLPNPYNVTVPTGVQYNSRAISTTSGDQVFALTLAWDTHPDAFVTEFGSFEVQYKLSDEPAFRPSFFVDGKLTETDIVNASINTYYDLRIRARNNLGVQSGWVTINMAIAGYSGGTVISNDWGYVYESPSFFIDRGSVADAPTTTQDWEYVS